LMTVRKAPKRSSKLSCGEFNGFCTRTWTKKRARRLARNIEDETFNSNESLVS
jgi:hypothetical protein